MSDFTLSVDFDARQVLQGFAKLEQDARRAGENAGKGIAEGLQGFSTRSVAALQQELQRLTQRQLKVDVDSRAFTVAGQQIKAVQDQLNAIQRKQVAIGVDSRSITALQSKLEDLQRRQVRVDVDSSEFIDLQRQIISAERELANVERKKIKIDVDANSITAITTKLQSELERLQQRQVKVDVDSAEFVALSREINRVQDELAQVERKRVAVGVDDRSIVALQNKLQALQAKQVRVDVDSSEFADLQRQIDGVQTEIANVERKRLVINVDSNSVTAITTRLQGELDRLQQRQLKVNVDGQEFVALQRQIDQVQKEIADVERKRVLVSVDANSIMALNAKLGDLQGELNKVAIGSDRFRELQGEIDQTRQELAKAGESTDKFRLLDGVIQGVAFSLSNAVVDGAGRAVSAIGSLIGNYAKLDTEIRKAAAAGGEQGGYGRLSAAIDSVGIEAAGTQQQVAELTTELVRGGLTIDQTTQALGGIVRGAEATATSYDQMGQIVTATLTAFGLQATETNRVVDALVQGANSSATDVAGLGEAFKTSAPAAKLLGISVEGLATAVGLFTNAGVTAGEAGTTLRNGLSQLASAAPQTGAGFGSLTGQAKEAADVMKMLKLDIYNANGTLRPMETVLLQLKGAFDKLAPSAQLQLASKLFGGTDDGTKWLAVLGQSEEKIKALAVQMGNAKGATDRNRDAMQGFQLTTQQLTGTLDSLGNNIGRIAAVALLPLVNAANVAVGAVAALPAPVKDTVIALGLLSGAVVGATTAYVVFQRVLQAGATQQAIAGVLDLAGAIGTRLASGISLATAAIPGLLTQLQLISQVNAGQALTAIGTAIKTNLLNAISAAATALGNFVTWLASVQFGSFVAGVRSAIAAVAPLALAVGAITAAVVVWQQTLSESKAAQDLFSEAQNKSAENTRKLETAIGNLGQKTTQSIGIWQQFSNFLSQEMGMREAAIQMQQLQAGLNSGEESARKFYLSIKDGSTITADGVSKARSYVEWLNAQGQVLQQVTSGMRAKADQAEREGKLDLANQYRQQADGLDAQARGMMGLSAAIQQKVDKQGRAAGMTAVETSLTEEQVKANLKRAETEIQINQAIESRPIDRQLAVGKEMLNLAQAIGAAEQSRFAVTRSALEYELQQAERRGASEGQIKSIKDQIAANDRNALQARYQALLNEQTLQRSLLALNQEKAASEANFDVLRQRQALLEIQSKIKEAERKGDRDQQSILESQAQLQQQVIGIAEDKVSILQQTQPLERMSAGLQAEAARNGLKAEAASKGYQFAINGTLQPVSRLAELQGRVSTVTNASADDQQRYARLAEQSGVAIGRTKDGAMVLGRSQQDVNAAVQEMNRQLTTAQGNFGKAGQGASNTRSEVDGIRSGLSSAKNPADALAGAFTRTGDKAPAIAQGSRDFAAYLAKAGGFGSDIAGLNLDRKMGSVATETGRAAGAAQTFYSWLQRAADLPGARWSGGPVEAGAEYRINELGQEAFLSAGRLSMINAPANSIWRAPSDGVVIPAGVTAQLQARAAVSATGGGQAGVAELAIEVGKLRAEVGNLARRDWSIRVTQRTGPTGSQVMRTLLS